VKNALSISKIVTGALIGFAIGVVVAQPVQVAAPGATAEPASDLSLWYVPAQHQLKPAASDAPVSEYN